jgi:hypothetical protein
MRAVGLNPACLGDIKEYEARVSKPWEDVAMMVIESGLLRPAIDRPPSREEIVASLSADKRAAYLQALSDLDSGDTHLTGKQCMVKTDETITLSDFQDPGDHTGYPRQWSGDHEEPDRDRLQRDRSVYSSEDTPGFLDWREHMGVAGPALKPRLITLMNPAFNALTQPVNRALKKLLQTQWDADVLHMVRGVAVRIVFAPGKTAEQLSQAANVMHDFDGIFILVCGDDLLIHLGETLASELGVPPWAEADMSMNDQTNGYGPLRVMGDVLWPFLEYDKDLMELGQAAYAAGGRVRLKNCGHGLVIVFKQALQLSTGASDTSVRTSINVGTAAVWSCVSLIERKFPTLAEAFAALGLRAKIIPRDTLFGLTFLKGWFVPVARSSDVLWVPLPSRVLKNGKTLRRPAHIQVVEIATGRVIGLCLRQRRAVLAASMALGTPVPRGYPIVDAFNRALLRAARNDFPYCEDFRPARRINERYEDHAAGSDANCEIDRDQIITMMCQRYDFEPDDIWRMETLLDGVNSLPVFVADDGFRRLQEVDY